MISIIIKKNKVWFVNYKFKFLNGKKNVLYVYLFFYRKYKVY